VADYSSTSAATPRTASNAGKAAVQTDYSSLQPASLLRNTERKCADTTGDTTPGSLAISNAKILIYFSKKYTEAILLNSTRKLLRFEITKMLIAV